MVVWTTRVRSKCNDRCKSHSFGAQLTCPHLNFPCELIFANPTAKSGGNTSEKLFGNAMCTAHQLQFILTFTPTEAFDNPLFVNKFCTLKFALPPEVS